MNATDYEAVDEYSLVMLAFVIPLTAIALLASLARDVHLRRHRLSEQQQ